MQLSKALTSLPGPLLLLLAAQTRAQDVLPTEIKKMPLDPGEKFYPHYYAFAELTPEQSILQSRGALLTPDEESELFTEDSSYNSSAILPFRAPFPVHGVQQTTSSDYTLFRRAKEALARLQGRQFACPSGMSSCSTIGQSNYCCPTGETCYTVQNQPDAGNVGCCPQGQNCGGTVGSCTSGSTACPASLGGGCCIAGYVCAGVGCVVSASASSTPTSVITLTTTSSTVIASGSPSTAVVTVVITITPSAGQPTTSTVTSTTTLDQTSSEPSTTTTTTNTGGQPGFRPTGSSASLGTTTSVAQYCPTGYYACLASAGSGCCQTGRDCSTTSCPAVPSTTIITNGATVVVAVSDASKATNGAASSTCASGWFLCGSNAGSVPGCCPSGYSCGTASCTLAASTATATVQKELPSSAQTAVDVEWRTLLAVTAGLVSGVFLVML